MATLAAPSLRSTAEHPRLQVVQLRKFWNGWGRYLVAPLTEMNPPVLIQQRGSNGENEKQQQKEDEGAEEPSCHGPHGFRIEVERTAPTACGLHEAEP
jgi:hypothetical protein